MGQHHFSTRQDTWPLVSSDDELIVMHRDALVTDAAVYIGAHVAAEVEIRCAGNREDVEIATGPHVGGSTLTIPAGGKIRVDLPGTGNTLDLVAKITPLSGRIYVHITSFGQFDAYFKQVDIPSL